MDENREEVKTENGSPVTAEAAPKKKKKIKFSLFKKRSTEKRRKKKQHGAILTFLFGISSWISHGLKRGFFGRLFSSMYYSEDMALKEGALCEAFGSVGPKNIHKLKFRNKLSALYEKSLFYRLAGIVSRWLVNSYVRLWGILLFTIGAMQDFVIILSFFTGGPAPSLDDILVGIGIMLVSLPMLLSQRRLGDALLEGRITRRLVLDFGGIEEEKLESDENAFGGYYSVALLFGGLLGVLSYFADPIYYLWVFISIVVLSAVISVPEAGMLLIILLLPFTSVFEDPSLILAVLLVIVFVSFLFKWIRGKRTVKIEILDVAVFIFSVMLFLGGAISAGGRDSFNSGLLYAVFILSYFLIVNMFRKKELITRSVKLIALSASVISIIGILEIGRTEINPSWIDTGMFSDIGNRVTSLFENPNMLSIYLIIAFPFVFGQIFTSKAIKEKLIYIICSLLILLCTVFTWSRGAWLGLAACVCVFLVCYSIKNIWTIVGVLATLPVWSIFLPGNIIERVISIGSFSDSSTVYRIYTWRGVFRMIEDNLFGGIGVGESAFKEVFPLYSYAGTEYVMHSHSLYLEIAVQLGIFGLLVFMFILFLYSQKCFEHIRATNDQNDQRVNVIAGISGIIGACVMGFTDHIWYNYRVFLFFWIVVGISCASVRINTRYTEKNRIYETENERSASADIEL